MLTEGYLWPEGTNQKPIHYFIGQLKLELIIAPVENDQKQDFKGEIIKNRSTLFLNNTNMKKCSHVGVTFFLPPNPPSSKLTQIATDAVETQCSTLSIFEGKGLIVKNKTITIALNL